MDPDTGLIYFKYDFGYEFGIILPGESKHGEIPIPRKTIIAPPKRTSDIEVPVYHETTKPSTLGGPAPQKKTTFAKNVKWEPTSESEMSEYEGEARRSNQFSGPRWDPSSCSPASLSPSIPSTSPAFNSVYRPGTFGVLFCCLDVACYGGIDNLAHKLAFAFRSGYKYVKLYRQTKSNLIFQVLLM